MIEKVMLATKAPEDLSQLRYPLYASPKLDGIRCALKPGAGAVSRRFKSIPNQHIWNCLYNLQNTCVDGELVTYDADGKLKTFNEISGDVMRSTGIVPFKLLVFDTFDDPTDQFANRIRRAENICSKMPEFLEFVPHELITCVEDLIEYEKIMVDLGYEGVMTRDPQGRYKEGRSTQRQQWLLKVKRFADDEALIMGYEEEMANTNEQGVHENGDTKRSQHKSGLVPKDRLGSLIVSSHAFGPTEFNIGSGFTGEQRKALWADRKNLIGRIITFTHQPSGAKVGGKPRFPVFKGFRYPRDMS